MIAYEGDKPYIFISYAHKDSERVLPILDAMASRGFRIWYDAGIEAGTEWPDYIAMRLENATACLAFLSRASLDSQNCRQEINYALDLKIPVLSVYLDELTLTGGMRMRLGLTQAIYYCRHLSLDSFCEALFETRTFLPCREDSVSVDTARTPRHVAENVPTTEGFASPLSDFEIKNGTLLRYKGEGGEVVVPDHVTIIGEKAFYLCSGLKSVILPDSVTEIRESAFARSSLESISIPNSVTAIGAWAFAYTDLASIVLPPSLDTVENNTFYCADKLQRITIPETVTRIGAWAFNCCESLQNITLPRGITRIFASTFAGCAALTSFTLPDGVTEISTDAFYRCRALQSVSIPDSVKRIADNAFNGCDSLTKVYISENAPSYAKLKQDLPEGIRFLPPIG